MLTIRERKKVVKALPKNGYQLIAEVLNGLYTAETIRKYMNNSKYAYNQKVFTAAFTVIENAKALMAEQRQKIKDLTA